jgi:beta-lactam-binding protein with PASTA domain
VLVLAFLVSLVGAGAIHVVLSAVQPKAAPAASEEARARVVVPDLVGLTVAGARRRADGDHLLLHVVGTAPGGRTDALRVRTQRPLAGSLVRVDDAVEVEVGPDEVAGAPAATPATAPPSATVQPEVDLAAAEERRRAIAAGVRFEPPPSAPTPTPTPSVAPPAPAPVVKPAPAPARTPVVAAPPAPVEPAARALVEVPYVGRTTEEDAQRRLEAAGFKVRTSTVFSPSVPTGRVILTRPAAGEQAARGASILVFIAE